MAELIAEWHAEPFGTVARDQRPFDPRLTVMKLHWGEARQHHVKAQ